MRALPSPALVISVLALFVGLTGGAVAAVKITGKQIKDGSITGKDIKNDSVTGTDIQGRIEGSPGPRGPSGPAGPAGPPGPAGGTGPVTYRSQLAPAVPGADDAYVSCPDGLVPTGGGALPSSGSVTIDSQRPVSLSGDDVPDSWEARTFNSSESPEGVLMTVICVAAPGTVTADSPR